jgi:hypothetical protein
MDAALRESVRSGAANRCEYCRIHQDAEPMFRFHVEHVIPRQHGGIDDLENLALACGHCNRRKGPNLTAIEPQTGYITPLFNPRSQVWEEHFKLDGGVISGSTPIGRATVLLLQMNSTRRVHFREMY